MIQISQLHGLIYCLTTPHGISRLQAPTVSFERLAVLCRRLPDYWQSRDDVSGVYTALYGCDPAFTWRPAVTVFITVPMHVAVDVKEDWMPVGMPLFSAPPRGMTFTLVTQST